MISREPLTPKQLRAMKYAAIVGVIFGLVCNSIPTKYQVACATAAQLFNLSCGGH